MVKGKIVLLEVLLLVTDWRKEKRILMLGERKKEETIIEKLQRDTQRNDFWSSENWPKN